MTNIIFLLTISRQELHWGLFQSFIENPRCSSYCMHGEMVIFLFNQTLFLKLHFKKNNPFQRSKVDNHKKKWAYQLN
jgi:hypothetical protein